MPSSAKFATVIVDQGFVKPPWAFALALAEHSNQELSPSCSCALVSAAVFDMLAPLAMLTVMITIAIPLRTAFHMVCALLDVRCSPRSVVVGLEFRIFEFRG